MLERLFRFAVGMLLVPLCAVVTTALVLMLGELRPNPIGALPLSVWALAGGFTAWVILWFVMPRPVRSYVLAHELTHALWGALLGARIMNIQVSRESGSVTLSESNFLITLAPYFFPLYTILVTLCYGIASVFYDLSDYQPLWLAAIGFTWAFHVTFTLVTLTQRQSDIRECGHLFSYTVIYLFTVAGIMLWVVAVSPLTLEFMVEMLAVSSRGAWAWIRDVALPAAARWQ